MCRTIFFNTNPSVELLIKTYSCKNEAMVQGHVLLNSGTVQIKILPRGDRPAKHSFIALPPSTPRICLGGPEYWSKQCHANQAGIGEYRIKQFVEGACALNFLCFM
jgi:hypothetical protein